MLAFNKVKRNYRGKHGQEKLSYFFVSVEVPW